jgi:uncharacterized protein YecT (DUF1311 family)
MLDAKRILVMTLCIAASAASAQAASRNLAEEKQSKCSDGDMMEMSSCIDKENAESEARLKQVYQYLRNALKSPKSLEQSQAAWLRFRSLQCNFEAPPNEPGSGVAFSHHLCLIKHTERRILDLEWVQPCNGCQEFKEQYYGQPGYSLPNR